MPRWYLIHTKPSGERFAESSLVQEIRRNDWGQNGIV